MPEINSKVSRYNTLKLASNLCKEESVEEERDEAAGGRRQCSTKNAAILKPHKTSKTL